MVHVKELSCRRHQIVPHLRSKLCAKNLAAPKFLSSLISSSTIGLCRRGSVDYVMITKCSVKDLTTLRNAFVKDPTNAICSISGPLVTQCGSNFMTLPAPSDHCRRSDSVQCKAHYVLYEVTQLGSSSITFSAWHNISAGSKESCPRIDCAELSSSLLGKDSSGPADLMKQVKFWPEFYLSMAHGGPNWCSSGSIQLNLGHSATTSSAALWVL